MICSVPSILPPNVLRKVMAVPADFRRESPQAVSIRQRRASVPR